MEDRRQSIKIAVSLVVLLVLILVGWTLYRDLQFRVVSTNPKTSDFASVSPFFDLTFNRQLASVSVTSNPAIIASYKVQGNVLDISLNSPLQLNKRYVVTLVKVTDTKGETMSNKSLAFVAKDIPATNLSQTQKQALLQSQTQYSQNHNDPILKYIPYSTLDFSLTPSYSTDLSGKTHLTIEAQLTITGADSDTPQDKQAAIAQKEAEVQQYIQSVGLNPNSYDIRYMY